MHKTDGPITTYFMRSHTHVCTFFGAGQSSAIENDLCLFVAWERYPEALVTSQHRLVDARPKGPPLTQSLFGLMVIGPHHHIWRQSGGESAFTALLPRSSRWSYKCSSTTSNYEATFDRGRSFRTRLDQMI